MVLRGRGLWLCWWKGSLSSFERQAIKSNVEGGWERFLLHVPNATLCNDGELARVGFMNPTDVRKYIEELEELGLTYLDDDGKAVDLVVCDQLRGPLVDCDWLQFMRSDFEGGKVGMAWWWHRPVSFGVAMPAKGLKLHTPRGWKFAGSLSDQYTFIPDSQLSARRDN